MVRMFCVMSSPLVPSPRVEPTLSSPFSYTNSTPMPSILGSTTYSMASSVFRNR